MASNVRAAAFRSRCLSLAKTCSMGLRSGEYFGRKNSLAPAEGMGWRTARPFWPPGLSLHDVAPRPRVWDELLLDVETELRAVDRTSEQPWRIDAVVPERRKKRHRRPATV